MVFLIFFKWFLIFFKGVFDSFLNLSFFVYAKKTEITEIDIAVSRKKWILNIYFHPDGV